MSEFQQRKFEVSSALSLTFETVGANLLLFVGLALILAGLPAFAAYWWQLSVLAEGQFDPETYFTPATLTPIVVVWLVSMVSHAVLQAALTRATVTHLAGEAPDFGQCLTLGVAMILPMIAIGLMVALGAAFAMILLIVPGIILWLCWSVVVPVYVQEKTGIFGAFGRSFELTRGSRWKIFLAVVVLLIGLWVIDIPAGMLTTAIGKVTGSIVVVALLNGVLSALGSMLMVTLQSSIYVELRNVKDGVAPSELEAIFA